MKYVIIGNGAAGIAAAEKIRSIDKEGTITILSSEKYPVYSKCLLPDFLSGQVSEDRLQIRNRDFYSVKNIDILYEHTVISVDFDMKQVITRNPYNSAESESIIRYDKLLIASGSQQIMPPVKGLDKENAYFLNTLDDAKRIIEAAKNARRIIIIGAGFVGLETAINLYKTGSEITIIERTPRILMNNLDDKAADIIQNTIQEEGIRLVLNACVEKISSTPGFVNIFTGKNTKKVILEDGRSFKADMIIVSTGSRPNTNFLKGTDLLINKGIVVDKFMRTSREDVYAAGDVVESIDAISGKMSLSPIWPNAVIQGETAGCNMAGKPREFDNLISMQNSSEFREIPMITMGIINPEGDGYQVYVDYRPAETVYRKLVLKDNVVVGMIFLGDIKNSGVIGALIKNRVNVGKIKHNMLNPNFGYSEVSALI